MTKGAQGGRELRPFPAIDPEPDHRYTGRTLLRASITLVVACAVAAGVVAGVRLASAKHPGKPPAAARFTDGDGLIVFQQEPSGLLGTASPDGSHGVIDTRLGGLQGSDFAVPSPDGRYLVTMEAQLVTLGADGPQSVTQVTPPNPAADQNVSGLGWMVPTFAGGGKYLAVTECDPEPGAGLYGSWAWYSWLVPLAGGKPSSLGVTTGSSGDPASAAALVSEPVNPAQDTCDASAQPDSGVALAPPGKPARVIITAAALLRAAGWKPGTPVQLSAAPSPDGSRLIVQMDSQAAPGGAAQPSDRPVGPTAAFLVSRDGKFLGALRLPGASQPQLTWSPDGSKVATCSAFPGQPSTVSVLTVGSTAAASTAKTITLPGRHDFICVQLLWSPDGTQLAYSAQVTQRGLTQASDQQKGWTIINVRTGTTHDVTAPGQPVAWVRTTKGGA